MNNTINLLKLRGRLLLKNSILLIPTVLTAVFICFMYSIRPLTICSSFLMSALFLYAICVFISMSLGSKENTVFEETLYLHCDPTANFFISRELLFLLICLIYALVLTVYPIVCCKIQASFFTRELIGADVICGAALIISSGLAGMQTGDLFHPRIMRRRGFAITGALFISVAAVCKYGILDSYPFAWIINFILPPVMDGFKLVGDSDLFSMSGVGLICGHMILYAIVVMVIKVYTMRTRRFG